MPKSLHKRTALITIWLALLVMLGVWIMRSNGGLEGVGQNPQQVKVPQADPAKLSAQWPQIVQHAAAPPRGKAVTPYTLAEFGDFECPQCGKVRPLLEGFLQQWPNNVNLLFVHRPFPQNHPLALPAAEASEAAAAQGKFWPMYDMLYTHQEDLEPGYYPDYAAKLGMNGAPLDVNALAQKYKSQVDASAKFCDDLKIETTPTVVLHNNKTGHVTIYVGRDEINGLLAHPPWPAPAEAASAKP